MPAIFSTMVNPCLCLQPRDEEEVLLPPSTAALTKVLRLATVAVMSRLSGFAAACLVGVQIHSQVPHCTGVSCVKNMAAVSSSAVGVPSLSRISYPPFASPASLPSLSIWGSSSFDFAAKYLIICRPQQRLGRIIPNASTLQTPSVEEVKDCSLPTWADFDLGRAPVFWKTTNGLPPTSGENLRLFYNPAASKLVPNDEFGIAFNGGFNQPIMCGGEPRAMTKKIRGKADPPIFTIKICIPQHAVSLIFSFTNGVDWDGPYRLQFEVLKRWRNKPLSFFNEGLAEELSKDGACEKAIFPDSNMVVASCAIGTLYAEGGDRCNLDFVPGCMDPSSPLFNPLANVDDGSCPIESDSENE